MYPRGSPEDLPTDAVASPSHGGAAKFAYPSRPSAPLVRWPLASLDAQILAAGLVELGWSRRLSDLAGKEVSAMRSYMVRVFVPQVIAIQAESEAEVLEKVGAYYQEQYAKDAGLA